MRSFPLPPFAVLLLPMLALSLGASPTAAEVDRDPAAVEVARRAFEATGGEEGWSKARHLRFEFFGARLHHWDRWTGRHRVEGETEDGSPWLVLHRVDEGTGRAWVDGVELEGEERNAWLERAQGAWVNDTYWLLMPTKMLDPGVHLAFEGTEEIDGRLCDRVRLSFDDVGLTPGDRYWAWVDREDGLMRRWAYHLEGWEADREPTAWDWRNWQEFGPVVLSPLRVRVEDGQEARLDRIAVYRELPDTVYEDPDGSGSGD